MLVDTNFLSHTVQRKLPLLESLMDLLYAKANPIITESVATLPPLHPARSANVLRHSCVMAELEKLGQRYRLALRIARDPRWERLKCDHKGVYADDCVVDRVIKHRIYLVATNDKGLKVCLNPENALPTAQASCAVMRSGRLTRCSAEPSPEDSWCAHRQRRQGQIRHRAPAGCSHLIAGDEGWQEIWFFGGLGALASKVAGDIAGGKGSISRLAFRSRGHTTFRGLNDLCFFFMMSNQHGIRRSSSSVQQDRKRRKPKAMRFCYKHHACLSSWVHTLRALVKSSRNA